MAASPTALESERSAPYEAEQCKLQVDISTELECSMGDAITHAVTTRLLNFVAYPLIQFTPLEPHLWPQNWAEGTYWVGVRIFGFVPFGKQAIVISYPDSAAGFLLRDNGHSALVKVWGDVPRSVERVS
jgi:hypothetical protein